MPKNNTIKNIWQELDKPIFILAPMEDVTDTVFRQIIVEIGKPDLFFTEFVNVDGLMSAGRSKVIHRLQYTEIEKPLVAQIWGLDPENFYQTSREISEMGFAGIDINMGCPVKKIVKTGACSALIQNHALAKEIIQATIEGSKAGGDIPVSVKTRIGFQEKQVEEWFTFLLSFSGLSAVTVHGRIAKDMSKKPADWDSVQRVVEIRDQINPKILIIGNGDVTSVEQGIEYSRKYRVDGIMIGRGIFQNPYLFAQQEISNKPITEKLTLALKHTQLFLDTWGNEKNPEIMKKFYKVYIRDFAGANELRKRLMQETDIHKLINILTNSIEKL